MSVKEEARLAGAGEAGLLELYCTVGLCALAEGNCHFRPLSQNLTAFDWFHVGVVELNSHLPSEPLGSARTGESQKGVMKNKERTRPSRQRANLRLWFA